MKLSSTFFLGKQIYIGVIQEQITGHCVCLWGEINNKIKLNLKKKEEEEDDKEEERTDFFFF